MKKTIAWKMAMAGVLIAVSVVSSPFSIPVGAARCFPIQHLINILSAVILGPFYGVAMAFVTSLIRIMLGTGTLLAFPGSMCGALICGLAYRCFKSLPLTCLGELLGTSVLGGIFAYPIAVFLMDKEAVLWTYIAPFFVSSAGGTVIAAVLLLALRRTKVLDRLRDL